jgi:hypothetical protein
MKRRPSGRIHVGRLMRRTNHERPDRFHDGNAIGSAGSPACLAAAGARELFTAVSARRDWKPYFQVSFGVFN